MTLAETWRHFFTCKQSLACFQWTRVEGPDLPGSTPCGRAFLYSANRKELNTLNWVPVALAGERTHASSVIILQEQ